MKRRIYRVLVILAILIVFVLLGFAGYSKSRQSKTESSRNIPDENVPVSDTREKIQECEEQRSTLEVVGSLDAEKTEQNEEDSHLPKDSVFEIHFFDVGEADSTLVECDGHRMLIDGGNPGSSRFLYAYLEQHEIEFLDYIVCTHAHEDHIGGLAGALNYANVGVAYAPVMEYDSRAFSSFTKYLGQQGKSITIPSAGDNFMLGHAEVTILAPINMELAQNNANNSSIVLQIVYGNTSFIITGDAEDVEEQTILKAGYDIKSTVLRVGHHGSNTSTSEDFLMAVDPDYSVISVGKENQYDHPHEEVLQRLQDSGTVIYRTDLNGEIDCISDGESVTFKTER